MYEFWYSLAFSDQFTVFQSFTSSIRDLTQGRRHLGGRRRNSCSVVDVLVAVVAIRATYASRIARVVQRPDLAGNYENIFPKSCLEGLRT